MFQYGDEETEALGGSKQPEAVTQSTAEELSSPRWVEHTFSFLDPGNVPAMSPVTPGPGCYTSPHHLIAPVLSGLCIKQPPVL